MKDTYKVMRVHPVRMLCYLCVPACGVLIEQSTNTVRVRSLIPIGSNDANDACTHCMMNAMEVKHGASVQWHMLNS